MHNQLCSACQLTCSKGKYAVCPSSLAVFLSDVILVMMVILLLDRVRLLLVKAGVGWWTVC